MQSSHGDKRSRSVAVKKRPNKMLKNMKQPDNFQDHSLNAAKINYSEKKGKR